MKIEDIQKSDVEFFFNKYKHNIDQIFYLERKLINESYNYEKWEKLLTQNSELTRQFFSENEEMIEKYLRPVIISPEKVKPEVLETYLRHILFFLFENNIDYHLTEDLPKAVLKNPDKFDEIIQFEANMCLALSHTVSINSTYEETYSYFKKCYEIYPNFESAPDDNTRVHVSLCYCYVLMMFILYRSTDYKEFLKCYELFDRNIHTGNKAIYQKMWGENTDYQFHIDFILRHFRLYGIMMAGIQNFRTDVDAVDFQEQSHAVNVIKNWMYEEYILEEEEGYINPMLFTVFHRDRYTFQTIGYKEYHNLLLNKFSELKKQPFLYPEANFPQDDDPVDPQFAKVADKMKLFNRSFTANYILLPELFKITKDGELKKLIIEMMLNYHERGKYAAKGFISDSFMIDNIKLVGSEMETATECASFIQTIFIHQQISTANHLSMVSNLASLCLTSFIEKRPELFILPEIADTVEQVKANKTSLMIYAKNAAMLHDVGKLGCSKLINLHFRKINSYEFGLIQEHPQKGAEIIEGAKFLEPYKDIILGHHKSWNGVSGYPNTFELNYSKYKYYVNLISICDAIDTSTDLKGRNYKEASDFDEIIEELRKDGGKTYCPELVEMILSDSKLLEELKYITGTGRNFISYKTYQQFILPNTKFSEEDEKSVVEYSKKYRSELEKFYKICYVDHEELIPQHIHEIYETDNSCAYILCDKRKTIFGVINGYIHTSMEDGEKYFFITEIIILPEERRKGLGSYLFNQCIPLIKEKGVSKMHIISDSDFSNSSFFWIEGFSPCNRTYMEKRLF